MAVWPHSIWGISLLSRKWFHTSVSKITSAKKIRIKCFSLRKFSLKSHFGILPSGATPPLSAHNTGCPANSETEIAYTGILPTGATVGRGSLQCESLCYGRRIRELCDPLDLIRKTTDILFYVTETLSIRKYVGLNIVFLKFQLSAISTILLGLPSANKKLYYHCKV